MQRLQRKALALAAALALSSLAVSAQTGTGSAPARGARGAQAAHAAADAGYKAYGRRDYRAAIISAQRAVQLAPNRRDYWLLLAQSLAANGQIDQAEQVVERAAQARGSDAALARVRTELARARAQAAGAAMYKALQANDVKTAVARGAEAVRLAPENAAFRLALVHALLRDEQHAEADRVATETIALLPESAAPLAMRGYARQALGRGAEAQADLDRALQQRGLPAAAQREMRLLAADLALAQGDGARAMELLQPLAADDANVAARRELARQPGAGAATAFPLRPPGIDCADVAASQTCTLLATGVPPAPGFINATAAYRALEARDAQRALEQARLATAASPSNREWHLMHMNAALAAGQPAEAERAASAALALRPDAATLAQRASIRRQIGDEAGSRADAEAALQAGDLPATTRASLLADLGRTQEAREVLASAPAGAATPSSRLDMAYLSTRMGDDAAARAAFAQADAAGGLPPTALMDAGYASMRAKQDDEAVAYFKRAVDAVNGLQLKMEPQMLYDTRRQIAEVSRKWGVLASVTSRNGSGVIPGAGPVGGSASGERVTQAGAEVYYRPWGFRNGQFVEVFARGFATLDSENGDQTGSDSFSGAAGARWKPLTSQNLVLSLSRTFGPNVTDDWLAQIGWSRDHGTDLRVDRRSWWTARLYAEAGRYLENEEDYGVASAMAGRSYVASADGRTVLFPHVFVGAEYASDAAGENTAAGAGPGVTLRRWFREDTYNAPRSYWDFTVQYRARLSGDARMKGLFLNALLSY